MLLTLWGQVFIGDRAIVSTGSSARMMLEKDNIPVDAVVVGIIDNDSTLG